MNNERLDHLFQEIREEKIETSIHEVNKWIALSAASVGLFGLLSHFKLPFLLTKKIIIMTTIALSIGIGATALFLSINHESTSNEKLSLNKAVEVKGGNYDSQLSSKDKLDFIAKNEPANTKGVSNANLQFSETISGVPAKLDKTNESKSSVIKRGTEIKVGYFNQVHVSGAYDVYISLGKVASVIVEGESAEIEKIEAKVNRGELHIRQKANTTSNNSKLVINITMTEITGVGASGASSIKSTMVLDVPEMDVQGTGAGNIDLQLKSKKVTVEGTGAANINLTGTTQTLNIEVTGACNLDCANLKAEEVDIVSTGSSNTKCNVNEKLKIDASGASHVKYKGDAKSIEVTENGAAKISKKG